MTNETVGLLDDFRDLLTTFADERVEFVLIGGWALALHGHGRGTDDLDVLIRPTSENATRVSRTGAPSGRGLRSSLALAAIASSNRLR